MKFLDWLSNQRPLIKNGKKTKQDSAASVQNIFGDAKTWADDYYAQAVVSRSRYQLLSFFALGLAGLLTIAIIIMMPLKKVVPLEINHYEDGYVSVTPINDTKAPRNKAQVESELVRYVTARESFSFNSYPMQFSLVNLLSSSQVSSDYIEKQDAKNKSSFLNTLGEKATRNIHIDSVNFLDRENWVDKQHPQIPHKNMAQVDYSVTTRHAGSITRTGYSALISWKYRGIPNSPKERWRNWDGFTVTSYQNNQRNI